jgi:hypothetical protein
MPRKTAARQPSLVFVISVGKPSGAGSLDTLGEPTPLLIAKTAKYNGKIAAGEEINVEKQIGNAQDL